MLLNLKRSSARKGRMMLIRVVMVDRRAVRTVIHRKCSARLRQCNKPFIHHINANLVIPAIFNFNNNGMVR